MFALQDYRSVLAIAAEGHFGRAARQLGCTQPSLSARLRRIEEALDVRLFERDRSGVRVTPAGEVFLAGAERVVAVAAETEAATRAAQAGVGQSIRIGMTQTAAHQIMVPVLAGFRAEHPRARLRLVQGHTSAVERQLEQNAIDVAFLHPPLHAPGLSELPLTEVRFLRVDRATGGASGRPLIRYPRAEAPVLMGELGRGPDWDVPEAPEIETDTMLGALVLSRAGYGPCVLPEDFPSPFSATDLADGRPSGAVLQTAVAWCRLDRRPLVRDLVEIARSQAPRSR